MRIFFIIFGILLYIGNIQCVRLKGLQMLEEMSKEKDGIQVKEYRDDCEFPDLDSDKKYYLISCNETNSFFRNDLPEKPRGILKGFRNNILVGLKKGYGGLRMLKVLRQILKKCEITKYNPNPRPPCPTITTTPMEPTLVPEPSPTSPGEPTTPETPPTTPPEPTTPSKSPTAPGNPTAPSPATPEEEYVPTYSTGGGMPTTPESQPSRQADMQFADFSDATITQQPKPNKEKNQDNRRVRKPIKKNGVRRTGSKQPQKINKGKRKRPLQMQKIPTDQRMHHQKKILNNYNNIAYRSHAKYMKNNEDFSEALRKRIVVRKPRKKRDIKYLK